jgi:hypothetical protein
MFKNIVAIPLFLPNPSPGTLSGSTKLLLTFLWLQLNERAGSFRPKPMILAEWMIAGEVEFDFEKLRNPQVNLERSLIKIHTG